MSSFYRLEALGIVLDLGQYEQLFVAGQVLSGAWGLWRLGRAGVPAWRCLLLPWFAVPSIIYGSHLFAWVTFGRPLGYVLYGGLFAALASGALAWRVFYRPWLSGQQWFDEGMVALLLGFIPCRVGCHISGCCYGTPVPGGWPSVTYPGNQMAGPPFSYARDIPLHPAAAYEALGMVLLLLSAAGLRKRLRPGMQGWLLLGGYAVLRLLLEFIRWDPRGGALLGLYPSQLMSLGVLAVMALALWTDRRPEPQD